MTVSQVMAVPWSSFHSVQNALSSEVYSLRNIRAPACSLEGAGGLPVAGDGLLAADLVVTGGRIGWIGAPGSRDDLPPGADLERALVWPCPIDCHTHLDKGQVWARSANRDGSFASAVTVSQVAAARYQGPADIARRAGFQLRTAHAHGTAAIRSHVDGGQPLFEAAFEALCGLVEDWRDRVILQLCPFTGPMEDPAWVERLAETAARQTPGILSALLYNAPELESFLDRILVLAERHGLALDFHADETLDPGSHCLRALAEAVLRHGFQGPVLAGHCCALSVQPSDVVDRTLDRVAEAGIGIVALPLCNAYLMDRRNGSAPRYRGHAPLQEMRRRGIRVAIASDNVRDAFYAYGDLDVPELFRDALRIMQLDHPVGDWPAAVTSAAADLMGLPARGRIRQGGPADLIVFKARNWSEFAARPLSDRLVLRNGCPIDSRPPDYRELDDLEGMQI